MNGFRTQRRRVVTEKFATRRVLRTRNARQPGSKPANFL